MLREAHFTYTTGRHIPYNEISVADRVVKACAWTDGSADFVFGDGTVLAFCDEMNTFVAISSGRNASLLASTSRCAASGRSSSYNNTVDDLSNLNSNSMTGLRAAVNGSSSDGDFFLTALTLTRYESKVKEALHVYNYYSAHPRIIAGLTPTPCEVWRHHSPIDSLVISDSQALFERHGTQATLWCALRRISLTLHSSRATFSVRWPAPAVERNGARSIFVRPVDEKGRVTGSLASLRAFHYTWVEQTFPVMDPPEEWAEMLQIALNLDTKCGSEKKKTGTEKNNQDDLTAEDHGKDSMDNEEKEEVEKYKEDKDAKMRYRSTPGMAKDRQPCRFSKLRREHVHALIAASQMQNATCNRLIRSPKELVLWRYDADPMGRIPHAVYWCLRAPSVLNSSEERSAFSTLIGTGTDGMCGVLAMIREDGSAVLAEPHERSYTIHHWRNDGAYREYHQTADGELGLPPVIPSSDGNNSCMKEAAPSPPSQMEQPDGMVASRLATSSISSVTPLYFSGPLDEAPFASMCRGRYLPDVGASCIHLSQLNMASRRAERQEVLSGMSTIVSHGMPMRSDVPGITMETAYPNTLTFVPAMNPHAVASSSSAVMAATTTMHSSTPSLSGVGHDVEFDRTRLRLFSDDPAMAAAALEGSVVFLTSAIDGVGHFAALTNGTIRCHFDDRTILFLIPGADDTEENLVATCLYRDATQCSIRLVKCLSHHPMYRYVAFALPFRRFARLSPKNRAAVEEGTAALKVDVLGDTEWRRENAAELELQALLGRTEELLNGSEELSRANRSLLLESNDDSFVRTST